MTTIPLTEALERATEGPAEADSIGRMYPIVHVNGVMIAKTDCSMNLAPWIQDAEEAIANAALLAHCRNHLPALVEAAQKYTTACANYYRNAALHGAPAHDHQAAYDAMKAALQSAQNVKLP